MLLDANVPTEKHQISGANIIEVEAGTNCPQGGDSGHGGRTVVRFTDQGGTDWQVSLTDRAGRVRHQEYPTIIEIVLGGDSEAGTFAEALEFAAQTIRRQMASNPRPRYR